MIRRHLQQFVSGPMARPLRRFVVVGAVTATVQMVLLWLFVDKAQLNYIVGAVIAIEITIVLAYLLNNAWTFRHMRNSGVGAFLTGLAKTNVVRGSAIPIQLAVLYLLVEYPGVPYLLSNVVAILVSGLYRFVLDSRWTWGRT